MGEQLEEKIQKGYAVFGKAYEIMLRNDLHDRNSIDHQFLKEMILLTSDSYQLLYHDYPKRYDMKEHELYDFAQGLKAGTEQEINNYSISRINEYYRKLLSVQHNGMWIMGEDGENGR